MVGQWKGHWVGDKKLRTVDLSSELYKAILPPASLVTDLGPYIEVKALLFFQRESAGGWGTVGISGAEERRTGTWVSQAALPYPSQRSPCWPVADGGRQLGDRADAAWPLPGQMLPAPAPQCCRRAAGLLPEPAGWPQSIASLSGSGSATASAFSPTYEPCFCFFLILEGLGLLCVRPVISVTAHLPSLVEEAKVALSPVPGHPSEGWREVIPRLPLSRQPCSAPGS